MAMTHGTTIWDGMPDFSSLSGGAFGGIFIILQIALYIFYAYCQYTLSKKLDIQYSWMAWIPILSFFNLVKIAGKSYWWVLWIILGFIAFVIPGVILHVMMLHGISKRTGHGGWWTAGLIFARWLFFPVTALHYEKGDEVTPRPFTGWRKGLLIFFALGFPILIILGIIAAAIYPAMNGHLDRSRDAARMSHIAMISTTLGTYYADRESYPTTPDSGCISSDMFPAEYMYGSQGFNDPVPTNIMPGCDGSDGTYAYRSLKGENGDLLFVVGAKMENKRGGNSSLPIDEITSDDQLLRGSGPYYYIVQ